MKNKWIAALALAGLRLTTGAYAESTPSETGAPVQAEAAAEPQHQLKVTTKYRYFISQYHYIRERKVSYFDNVYAYNHGEYGLTPFASTVPEEYFVADENGTLAIAPIVLDITDAMRERLYGADVGETALYYGQYCQREKDRKGVWGYTGIHEGIDFVNVKGAPLYAILGGEVTRGTDKNGTVAIYNAEYDRQVLRNTFARYGLPMPRFDAWCAMQWFARVAGVWNSSRQSLAWQSLAKAARFFGMAQTLHSGSVDGGVGGDHPIHPMPLQGGCNDRNLRFVEVGCDLHKHGHAPAMPGAQGLSAFSNGAEQGVQGVIALQCAQVLGVG